MTQRFIKLFSLLILILHTNSSFGAQDSEAQLDPQRIYLVHASRFLIKQSTATAGASRSTHDSDTSFILPKDTCMEVRQTLHHCLGNLVPFDAMGTSISYAGFHIPISTEGNDTTPFAYLDTLGEFLEKKEVFGGQVNDLFTTSHTYGKTSIVVIPENQQEEFKTTNPSFEGELRTYDSSTQNLRDAVNKIIQEKKNSQWVTLTGRTQESLAQTISGYRSIQVNGIETSPTIFEDLFTKYGLFIGDHNYSPFYYLETILDYFGKLFGNYHVTKKDPWKYSLPTQHIPPLLALAEFQFNEFFAAISHLSQPEQSRLRQWRKECWEFIKLHQLELELRQENRSLLFNNENFEAHLKSRASLTIDQLRQTLSLLDQNTIQTIEEKTTNTAMDMVIPAYYTNLCFNNPRDLQLIRFMQGKFEGWAYGPGIILENLFRLYFQSNEMALDSIQSIVSLAFEMQPPLSEILEDHIRGEFWLHASHDDSPGGQKVLILLNSHPQLRKMLGFIDAEVTFPSLLEKCPSTTKLFDKNPESTTNKYHPYAAFLRDTYLAIPLSSLKLAGKTSSIFSTHICDLSLISLNGENNSFLNFFAGFASNLPNCIDLLKAGFFGTLEEVFTSLELKAEFREKFPTDEDFWQYKSGYSLNPSTFASVYSELKRLKESKASSKSTF